MDKILLTGAPGWLGTRAAEVLSEKKREFSCLVLPGLDASYLEKLGAEIIHGDVTDPTSLEAAVKGVSTVFHLAGLIHPKKISDLMRVNAEGTRNLLSASEKAGVRKFVYVSSNSAAGSTDDIKMLMTEDMPAQPQNPYGQSKRAAELAVLDYGKRGLNTTILRPCWFYGPRQPERMVKLMKMIQNGSPLVFGEGKNWRSMTHIDNLVDALLLVENHSQASDEIFWIADERPYETIEIYQTIADEVGVTLKPRFVPALVSKGLEMADLFLSAFGIYEINVHVGGEMIKNIACSIDKAKKVLGYSPRYQLREGVKQMVQWARENNLMK